MVATCPFWIYGHLVIALPFLVGISSVAVVRSKDHGLPDQTNFGLDWTAQMVCGPKTKNYGLDRGWIGDCEWISGISKTGQPSISYRLFVQCST